MKILAHAINKKTLPYNLSSDEVLVRVSLLTIVGNPTYLKGISINFFSNFTGVDALIRAESTNVFGVVDFIYNTNQIIDKTIDTGLIWVEFTYNGDDYVSNKTRINFIYDAAFDIDFTIIDGGYDPDRNSKITGIYDAGIRHPSNPSGVLDDLPTREGPEYTIIERGNF